MFITSIQGHFDAAHKLPGYAGDCANLHGHRWIAIARWKLSDSDYDKNMFKMTMDFKVLKTILHTIIDRWDHSMLNDEIKMPTAECLARRLFVELATLSYGEWLYSVTIIESPGCEVTYSLTSD